MGGAVSSGRDNNELVDNLISSSYIRTRQIERVFRVLDRADFMTPEARNQAYRDLAWRNGPLHLSAPCIYSEVMEGLDLRPGISFLNIGSGTGYLSTLAGLIIGAGGISHGIEVHPSVVEYATLKLKQFIEDSPTLDEFDFCEPKYFCGNGLCLAPLQAAYDRVYCGAGCPEQYLNYMKQLIKVDGILVMPLNDSLIQMRRLSRTQWVTHNLHHVSFATLRIPTKQESSELIQLDELSPPRLQVLARGIVRTCMRKSLQWKHPELREPPPKEQPVRPPCPRRICIPIEDDSDVEGLNALHDLDRANGANEMNALLSLVLSMGHNRVAGALRFDTMDSHSDSDSSSDDDDDSGTGGGGDGGSGGDGGGGSDSGNEDGDSGGNDGTSGELLPRSATPLAYCEGGEITSRRCRGVLTLEFQDTPQPTINVSRQPPDILINNNENTTLVASGFTIMNTTSMNVDGNSSTAIDTEISKTETDGTPGTENAKTDTDTAADANAGSAPPANLTPRTKSIKSKITLRKSKSDTINADEGSDTKTESSEIQNAKPNKPKRKMPAEVEIYLASKSGTSTSYRTEMDWEDTVEIEIETSDEDTEESKESKRKKIDSGIGEETSPTSARGSSPEKTETNEDSEIDGPLDAVIDDVDTGVEGRNRQQKRGHGHLGTQSCSSSEAEDTAIESGARSRRSTRRCKRRATPSTSPIVQSVAGNSGAIGRSPSAIAGAQGPEARRARLSIMMKRGVKELPLPYALKKYINHGRCFQF